ncbi:hypothetical protein TNCV_57921 [Trichonephila clavipes]|nr:hypothetical protein TNCV_57921 [Trichonephila clavipes]
MYPIIEEKKTSIPLISPLRRRKKPLRNPATVGNHLKTKNQIQHPQVFNFRSLLSEGLWPQETLTVLCCGFGSFPILQQSPEPETCDRRWETNPPNRSYPLRKCPLWSQPASSPT